MASEIEIVRVPVALGRSREFAAAIRRALSGYLALPGCTNVELLTTNAGDEVVAIVRWSSSAAHKQAAEGPHGPDFFALVESFAVANPQVHSYVSLDDA